MQGQGTGQMCPEAVIFLIKLYLMSIVAFKISCIDLKTFISGVLSISKRWKVRILAGKIIW